MADNPDEWITLTSDAIRAGDITYSESAFQPLMDIITPIFRKFGFKNINRKEYVPINIDTIQLLIEQKKIKKQLKIENILELNLAHKGDLIKILGRGKLESPVEVYAHKFSKSAENIIVKAGGKVIKL